MNPLARYFTILLFAACVIPGALLAQQGNSTGDTYGSTMGSLGEIPPSFIQNEGQWPDGVEMLVQGKGYNLWVKKGELLYDLFRVEALATANKARTASSFPADIRRTGAVVRMTFVGASKDAAARGLLRRGGYNNYFLGNDQSRWASNVPTYEEARITNLYSGIDALLRFENGEIRYDLLLEPGADPMTVQVRYDGVEAVRVDPSGDLVLRTAIGELRQRKPYAYQMDGETRRTVTCSFAARADGSVGFKLGSYDPTRPLVIDPLIYSTVIGGGAHDAAYDMKVDRRKNIYLTGWTFSPRFPVNPGGYSETFNGDSAYSDLFVTKINSDSGKVIYSTFIGGVMNDVANAIELDTLGNVYLVGSTESGNFPFTRGAYDTTHNSQGLPDAFITKLSADGSRLIYSTFLGGAKGDEAFAAALDSVGNIYVGGSTYSANYPAGRPAFDTLLEGAIFSDAFLAKLSANGTQMIYSTYLGGSQSEQINDIAVDRTGRVYLAGGTWSTDFPLTPNAARRENHSVGKGFEQDGFFTAIAADGLQLVHSTYLGGDRLDVVNGLVIDSLGKAILCGETRSVNFPVSKPYDTLSDKEKLPDAFVMRIDPVDGVILRSTVIGGSGEDVAYDVAMNRAGMLAVCGISNSTNFPVTSGAYDISHSDTTDIDAFFLVLDSARYTVNYASYIGGGRNDYAHAIGLDAERDIYIAGATSSTNYPTTTGPYAQSGGGAASVFVSRFSLKPASVADDRRMVTITSATIAPNPTSGRTRLAIPNAEELALRSGARITLFTSLGDAVLELEGSMLHDGAWGADLDLSGLAPGNYYARIVGSAGAAAVGPIVVVR